MRNIPVFTTEYGAATLILESIPARKEAFIRILSSLEPEKLLLECQDFCVACGAERVFASGHECLEAFPFAMAILQMNGNRQSVGETDAALFPIQEKTASQWRNIYNEKMSGVPKAAFITEIAMKKRLKEGNAYFVHRDGQLLGIGVASGNQIDAVAVVVPGAGETVVQALCHALSEDVVTLEVASTNQRAIRLYERLGFIPVQEISRWYKIFPY